jgi:uncharacterized protein (DUF486 family)
VGGQHLLHRPKAFAAELAGHGIGAGQIGIDYAHEANGFALLLEFLIDAGVVASENAYAHYHDRNRILRLQEKFSLAGCRQQIVTAKWGSVLTNHGPKGARRKAFRKGIHRLMRTIVLLTISNIFMTFAWYGHLKYRDVPLFQVIVVSRGIAFFEYCFQVPANRIGSYEFSAAQLKTIQEVITLAVFSVFSVLYLKQPVRWNHITGSA